MILAFVLLTEARLPDPQEVVRAYGEFAPAGEIILADADETERDVSDEAISFKLNSALVSAVALMPIAIPDGEAEEYACFSLSSFKDNWEFPSYCAHLVVTLQVDMASSPVDNLSRFTSLVAAVTKVSPAVGVYWGNAGATHDSEFFISVASDKGVVPRMMLWTGVSIAREKDGPLSLLSLGMRQLDLPDLLLLADKTPLSDALATLFDLLAYVAERGEAIAEGDTVGGTPEEKFPIHYVDSPVDSSVKVWRVELP